ncbi:LysM peptidoglycan-binding domain-containing M23 family metallopeptidase [Sediminispirochaeta bajacaliforniensis]|uniref:LysM peptidoglycan-binding domain-containing M23 family metallopeptidase n=1 Tax=Sediminispirochaeta bajacaliforniensis TaxID=148 RepID=UPI00036B8FF0|nr:M23 family metallopeptidase [Sediminispirochaeta bajacaliforniensis]
MIRKGISPFFALMVLSSFPLVALPYPQIAMLQRGDPLFTQLMDDIEASYRADATGDARPPLAFFSYTPQEDEDVFSLSARCSLPYDTLASLNRLDGPSLLPDEPLLIPNQPGLFLATEAESDLEILSVAMLAKASEGMHIFIRNEDGSSCPFLFFPEKRFNALQRAYFLGILFRLPVKRSILTSSFGMRRDPFTGDQSFHHGIDLAVPEGTPVMPARSGIVEQIGYDSVLGNYVILSHEGGYETVYGHLKSINVQLKSPVRLDMIVGSVGNTGRSTGPHLHFEIRFGGMARDPQNLLPEISK